VICTIPGSTPYTPDVSSHFLYPAPGCCFTIIDDHGIPVLSSQTSFTQPFANAADSHLRQHMDFRQTTIKKSQYCISRSSLVKQHPPDIHCRICLHCCILYAFRMLVLVGRSFTKSTDLPFRHPLGCAQISSGPLPRLTCVWLLIKGCHSGIDCGIFHCYLPL
jgi:hypothetical protein